ncbi:hypothetical protein FBULB1_9361 [Fusarium bulbicola]|nr:hypothetical protein FBULB1_9361 [Fusarium bulbicola]
MHPTDFESFDEFLNVANRETEDVANEHTSSPPGNNNTEATIDHEPVENASSPGSSQAGSSEGDRSCSTMGCKMPKVKGLQKCDYCLDSGRAYRRKKKGLCEGCGESKTNEILCPWCVDHGRRPGQRWRNWKAVPEE